MQWWSAAQLWAGTGAGLGNLLCLPGPAGQWAHGQAQPPGPSPAGSLCVPRLPPSGLALESRPCGQLGQLKACDQPT